VEALCYLFVLGGNVNRRQASAVEPEIWPMAFKRMLVVSILLGLGGGLAAYALAWGLFATHPELGMEPASGRAIALWVAPLVFLGSLIYFAVKNRDR
jgi:hypothetical protein